MKLMCTDDSSDTYHCIPGDKRSIMKIESAQPVVSCYQCNKTVSMQTTGVQQLLRKAGRLVAECGIANLKDLRLGFGRVWVGWASLVS